MFVLGVQASGEVEWDQLWTIYLKETNAQERVSMINALSNAKQPWLIKR